MKKRISLLLVFAMLISLLVPVAATTVSAEEPTLITDQAGLSAISASGNYKLANDITLSGTWNFTTPFTGEFDGAGYTITLEDGIEITGGLFCELQAGAYVHDLTIVQEGDATWNYYTGATGAQAGSIGAVAGYTSAAGNHSNLTYIVDASNKIRVENVTATVVIVEYDAVSGTDAAAIGGIIGEVGMYTEVKNCAVSGMIYDDYDHSADNLYFSNNNVTFERSSYGGIVGLAFRKTILLISECLNEAEITASGLQGGILGGSPSCSDSERACNITVERCLNKGTVTTNGSTTSSVAGSIVGAVFSHYTTAYIQNNINVGSVVKGGNGYGGGIVAVIRRGQANKVFVRGNLQESDTISGGQIVTVETSGATTVFANNYGRGAGNSTYSPLSDAAAYQSAYETLNAAYPDVFAMYEGKVTLIWALPEGYHEHTWGEWIVDVAATCTEAGSKHRTCTQCDETENEEIPAGHNYNEDGVCTVCGDKNYGEITSQADFATLIAAGEFNKYKLANDITISGTWNFSTPFTGEFDGAGHTITFADGIVITGGLFCELQAGAYVHDVIIVQEGAATWNYYTAGNGAQTGSIGAVAAYVGAAGNGGTSSYITNAENKIRVENIDVTVNISESEAVSGSNEAAAIGGIVGEIGMYTEIKNCTVSGSITDTYNHSAENSYFNYSNVNFERSSYGGIVGLAFRKTNLLISECLNEASITGMGLQGGILGGTPSCSNSETACNIVVERCLNKGTITSNGSTTSSVAGGIVGAIFSHNTTAYVQNNINLGKIARAEGSSICAGLVAVIRRGQPNKVFVLGNLQLSDAITGNQIVTVETSSATTTYTNNYGRGTGGGQYSALSDAAAYASAYETLNAAYPDVFFYDDTVSQKIGLRWTVHTGEWIVDVEATCTSVGSRHFVCETCGKTFVEEIPMIAHDWEEWTIDAEATCTAAGSKHRDCKNCEATEVEELPMIAHSFDENDICTVCGSKNYAEITNQENFVAQVTAGNVPKYILLNDITISGTWDLAVIFTGNFDGRGHTITFADGVVITGGLFQKLGAGAYVHDLIIVQAGDATWNYLAGATGSTCGSIGGLAAFVTADSNYETESYTMNAANKVRIENVTVTANIAVDTAVPAGEEAAAIGGIVGEMNLYTEITRCIFNGSITDTYDHSAINSAGGNSERSSYGGILGLTFRHGIVVITECMNNANITGLGQVGGILGAASPVWNGELTFTVTIQRCVNKGTIYNNGTDTNSSTGGIAGYVFIRNSNRTATILGNINYGTLGSNGAQHIGGMVGRLRRGTADTFRFIANLQISDDLGGGSQISRQTDGSNDITYQNNYGRGTGGSRYAPLTYTKNYIEAYLTLNELYPDTYVFRDKKVALKWTDTASFDDAMTGVVGAQLRDNAAEGKQDIRIVAGLTIDAAGLDTLESVGIEVIAYYGDEGEKNEKSGETGTIYESILAAGETITAEAVGFNYLYTMRITGVPSELGTLRLLVRTYHVAGEDTVYSDYAILSVNLTA